MPALAQTPVVTLKAADEVGAAISFTARRPDRRRRGQGSRRRLVAAGRQAAPGTEISRSRTVAVLFAPSDQIIVALADGAIEVRAIATGALVRRMEATGRQSVLAVSADGRLLATSRRGADPACGMRRENCCAPSVTNSAAWRSLAFSPDGTTAGKCRARRERASLGRVDRSAEGLRAPTSCCRRSP